MVFDFALKSISKIEKKRIEEMDAQFEQEQEDKLREELSLDPNQPVPMDDALNETKEKIKSGEAGELNDDSDGQIGASDDSEYDSEEAEKEEQLDEAWSAGQFGTEDVPLGGHNFFRDITFLDGKKKMEDDQIRADMEKLKKEREEEQAAKGTFILLFVYINKK